ncbi:MAG: T9SS type A sorting domain-containing protein [Bacteroidetes bacterium]|nr:T9SS type A sorting domain-containing protein [Bacteroidota bacterium]
MKKELFIILLFICRTASAQPVIVGGVETGVVPLAKPAIVTCAPIFSYYVPGASSNGLAWDGTAMYTRSVFSDSIHLNDPSNGNLITTIHAPSANGNQISGDLEYDGVNLWSIQEQLGTLFKMNPFTGQVINQYSLPNNNNANPGDPNNWGIAFQDGYLWHSEYGTGIQTTYMHKIDTANGMVVDTFLLQHAILPIKFINGELWGVAFDTPFIYKIDLSLKSVTDSIPRCVNLCYGILQNAFGFWLQGNSSFNGIGIHRFQTISGVDEQQTNDINIYPNPVSDYLHIDGLSDYGQLGITLTDITGRIIIEENRTNSLFSDKMNLSNLPSGMYLLSVESENKHSQIKIIKL